MDAISSGDGVHQWSLAWQQLRWGPDIVVLHHKIRNASDHEAILLRGTEGDMHCICSSTASPADVWRGACCWKDWSDDAAQLPLEDAAAAACAALSRHMVSNWWLSMCM